MVTKASTFNNFQSPSDQQISLRQHGVKNPTGFQEEYLAHLGQYTEDPIIDDKKRDFQGEFMAYLSLQRQNTTDQDANYINSDAAGSGRNTGVVTRAGYIRKIMMSSPSLSQDSTCGKSTNARTSSLIVTRPKRVIRKTRKARDLISNIPKLVKSKPITFNKASNVQEGKSFDEPLFIQAVHNRIIEDTLSELSIAEDPADDLIDDPPLPMPSELDLVFWSEHQSHRGNSGNDSDSDEDIKQHKIQMILLEINRFSDSE